MLPIVLLLVPLLPLMAYLSLRTPSGAPLTRISKPREIFSRLSLGLLFPFEWMLYHYLLPRQQAFLGLHALRLLLFGVIVATSLYLAAKAIRKPATDRTGSLLLAAGIAIAGLLAANVLFVWLCNLAFLLPGTPSTRTFQLTAVRHDHGKGSSHSDTLSGQMQGRTGLTTIRTYPFDGPDPNAALMTLDGHHFCGMAVVQPGDILTAQGHTNLFGFAIDQFQPANDRLRAECTANTSTYRP